MTPDVWQVLFGDASHVSGFTFTCLITQVDIIHQINDYFGADYDIDTCWSDLFAEPPEQQEAMRLSRLRSGSLPTSPRVGKGGPGGVGSLAAAVAAVMQQQQHWPAVGAAAAGRRGGAAAARRAPAAALQQLQGELADTDSEDGSYSGSGTGDESGGCRAGEGAMSGTWCMVLCQTYAVKGCCGVAATSADVTRSMI